MRLKGKIALVLGASAERGIGWASAQALAAEGATVMVGARTTGPLEKLAKSINGGSVQCDVTSESDVEAAVAATVERYGRLDITVNSAGSPVPGSIERIAPPQVQAALNINYLANYYVVKYSARAMTDGGSIVLLSSISASNVAEPHFAYASAKAATDCMVRYAALEYGPRGIRVNSILPGPVLTDMTADFYSNQEVADLFAREVPLRRLAQPSDIADAVVWLAGPSFCTGLNLQVNGGNYLTRLPRPDELPPAILAALSGN